MFPYPQRNAIDPLIRALLSECCKRTTRPALNAFRWRNGRG